MIAVLLNSRSGKGKAIAVGEQIALELSLRKVRHKLFSTWPESLELFTETWVVGGDGTINYYLNKYKDARLPVALFPAGTGNDFARMLYGKMNIVQQITHVLQSTPRLTDVGSCNAMLYINSAGLGFDGEVLKSMQSIRRLGGKAGYMLAVIKNIFSFREISFKIFAGSKTWKGKFLLVAINNSKTTGGGIQVSPNASLDDGLLDLVLCDGLSTFSRIKYLPVIEKGKHLGLPFIHYLQGKEFIIESSEELSGQIDGEIIFGHHFIFRCLPAYLRVKY